MLRGILGAVVGLPLAVVVGVFYLALYGASFMLLWNWFVVPLGMKSISILHAVGLTMLVGLLSDVRGDKDEGSDAAEGRELVKGLLRPIMAVAFGFLIVTYGAV